MAGLHFDITGDNTNLLRKLQETEDGVKSVSKTVEKEGGNIEDLFNRLARSAAAIGVGFSAKEFISKVAQVRGEFQKLEVAFTTMLGSKEQAENLMEQMVRTAATTPFSLQDVAGGAKQLLAYGIEAENVNETLIRLGDIAAGLSIPLGDLVYLYGTTRAQGRLYTEDFNQFTSRGIPMIEMLADKFGVAESEVKGLVEAGKVGFPEVQEVIENLTNEGGKFGGLMEAQSKTIAGQISNIEDSIETMFNNIGKANEGVINDALSGVSYLVENYEKVGKTIIELVGAYGTYKAVLITITALQKAHSIVMAQAVVEQQLAASAGITLSNAQAIAAARTKLFQIAQASLNKTLMANPYVAVAAAVTALGYGIYKLVTYQTDAEKAQENLNKALDESEKASLSEQRELSKLKGELSALTKGTDEYNDVKDKIVKGYSKYYDGLDKEIEKVGLTEQAYLKLTDAITKAFGARQYEKFKESQQEELDNLMSENLSKIQDRLIQKLGEEQGTNIYTRIRNAILSGSVKSIKGTFNLTGLDKETSSALDKAAGSGGLIENRAVEQYIANILNAIKYTEDLDKLARQRFGVSAVSSGTVNQDNKIKDEDSNYQEDYDAAKKAWEEAKKKLEEIEKDKKAFTSKQYEDAKTDYSDKKKQYESLGGVTSDKAVDDSRKQAEEQKKLQQELYETLIQLRFQNQQDEINLMNEGSEKKRKQIELDYQKEIEAYNKAKAKYGETDEVKDMKSNAETKRSSGLAAINEEEQKKEQERIKAQEDAWNEALIKFGDYNQKRKAIIEKYDKEIAQAQNAGDEWAKTEEKKAALEELDEQYGKSTRVMADLFEDAGEKSVTAIQKIIDKYETLVKYLSGTEQSDGAPVTLDELKAIGFTDKDIESIERGEISIRDLTDALKNMNGELKGKSPWMSFVNDMQKSIGKIKSAKGDSEKIGEGVMGIGNAVTDFAPALGEFAENIGSIFGVDGEKIQGIVGSIQGLGQTATGVGQILSGDVVGGAMSAVGGISKVVSSLEGLFGADYSEYENMKAQYDTLISVWDTLIGKKTEYIDIDYGVEAQKAADEAARLVGIQIQRQRQLAKMLASSGSSVGSHSLAYRVNDRMNSSDWSNLSVLVGKQVGTLQDVLNLDADVIGNVLQDEHFVSVLTTVNSDFIEYIQNIEKYSEQLGEIAEKEREALTGIGFDAFRDGYLDMLSDLESTNEDFADNFEKNLQNAILSSLVANKYSDRIKSLYEDWAKAGEDGLTSREAEELRREQQQIVEDMLADREQLMEDFGWSSSSEQQSASSRGFETMSQDTADELNGRFTALYEVGLQILQNISVLQSISVSAQSSDATLLEIKNLMILSNGHLEDISTFAKKILEGFGKKLDDINTNLKNAL